MSSYHSLLLGTATPSLTPTACVAGFLLLGIDCIGAILTALAGLSLSLRGNFLTETAAGADAWQRWVAPENITQMSALASSGEWTSPCASWGPRQSYQKYMHIAIWKILVGKGLLRSSLGACWQPQPSAADPRASRTHHTPQERLCFSNLQGLSPGILDATPLHRSSLLRQPLDTHAWA